MASGCRQKCTSLFSIFNDTIYIALASVDEGGILANCIGKFPFITTWATLSGIDRGGKYRLSFSYRSGAEYNVAMHPENNSNNWAKIGIDPNDIYFDTCFIYEPKKN